MSLHTWAPSLDYNYLCRFFTKASIALRSGRAALNARACSFAALASALLPGTATDPAQQLVLMLHL